MWHLVTLTFTQGQSIYWKFGKYPFLTMFAISQTLFTVELWDMAKRLPWVRPSTQCGIGWPWPKVKVTIFTWRSEKVNFWPFLTISQTLFIGSKVMKSCPLGSLWRDLQNDVTFSDLDQRSRSWSLLKNRKISF